ncbi:hypothetical protein KR222_004685, partial [Zaprionus bogoriensis]
AMARIFELIYPAPLLAPVRSREACTYLYRCIRFVGWLPPETGRKRYVYLLWTCLAFALSGIYVPIGFTLNLIVDFKLMRPGEFLSVLQISLNAFGSSIKSIIGISSLSRLHKARSLLDQLEEKLCTESDQRKMHKAVALCNRIFLIYGGLYLAYTISELIAGVIGRHPPWMIYNPLFNWRDGGAHFWMHMILEYYVGSMAVTMDLVCDAYTLVYMTIFRAYVDILKDHIRNLRKDKRKTEAENYDDLVGCIHQHKLILECCNLLRPVFSGTIFVQFLLIGSVLGVTVVNVLWFSGIMQGLASIVFLAIVLMQTFPFCYLCDLLIEDCEDLSDLLGHSHWVGAEPQYKSTLKIFMHHVQQPIQFIAGPTVPISMTSNLKVAKFAFSVITIVEKMNLAERFK